LARVPGGYMPLRAFFPALFPKKGPGGSKPVQTETIQTRLIRALRRSPPPS
jgi:hypothetical protein